MNTECKSFRPIHSNILIRPDDAPDKIGRIIIPDSAKGEMRPARGVVVAMGPGMLMKNGGRWPMPPVKPGDRVLFKKSRADVAPRVTINGVEHIILNDDTIDAAEENTT